MFARLESRSCIGGAARCCWLVIKSSLVEAFSEAAFREAKTFPVTRVGLQTDRARGSRVLNGSTNVISKTPRTFQQTCARALRICRHRAGEPKARGRRLATCPFCTNVSTTFLTRSGRTHPKSSSQMHCVLAAHGFVQKLCASSSVASALHRTHHPAAGTAWK